MSVGTPGSDGAKNEREPGNNVIAAPVETKENPQEVEIRKRGMMVRTSWCSEVLCKGNASKEEVMSSAKQLENNRKYKCGAEVQARVFDVQVCNNNNNNNNDDDDDDDPFFNDDVVGVLFCLMLRRLVNQPRILFLGRRR